MPSKPKPKPAKARKPMVVWVVVDRSGEPVECLPTHVVNQKQAKRYADQWKSAMPSSEPFRVVRFVEAPLRRKGGK